MEKWKIGIICIVVAVILSIIVLVGIGAFLHTETTENLVYINGEAYARDITELDLSGIDQPDLQNISQLDRLEKLDLRDTGLTVEAYTILRQAMPQCEILWSVPFQGGYLDSSSQSVTLTTLSEADINLLDYLPDLQHVDGTDCRDYDALLELRRHRPECDVAYLLEIQGAAYPLDTTALTLDTISAQEIELMLRHMPLLESISLSGLQEEPLALLDLMEQYPELNFDWCTSIFGVTVNVHDTFLNLSGLQIQDLEELETLVSRLPNMQQVDMCGCGISDEEMDALNRRHENIKFVWVVDFGWASYRTDITNMIPCMQNLWFTDEMAKRLRYFTDMECLDLGHHSITNCEFVRYMPKLKYLLLADTKIYDLSPVEDLENLIYLEIFLTDVRDYTPLLKLTKLQSLNLSYTEGQWEVIAQMPWLDYVRWVNYYEYLPSTAELKELRESLPDTFVEIEIGTSSTGGQWRLHQNYFDMRDILGMYYMTG